MEKITFRHIVETLGYQAITDLLDVKYTAVNNAVNKGKATASWYLPLNELYREKTGQEIPVEAFSFKQIQITKPPKASHAQQ